MSLWEHTHSKISKIRAILVFMNKNLKIIITKSMDKNFSSMDPARLGPTLATTLLHGLIKYKPEGRPRLKYFDQIIREMGCETFREVKQLAGDRAEWKRVVSSNQS